MQSSDVHIRLVPTHTTALHTDPNLQKTGSPYRRLKRHWCTGLDNFSTSQTGNEVSHRALLCPPQDRSLPTSHVLL
eukprot:1512782-Karenia_brevis.AAC.1